MPRNGLVLLAGPGESTNILYHALKNDCLVDRVILEEPVPRAEFLRKRIKRLGPGKVFGQVAFQAIVVPWLKQTSGLRIGAIRREYDLDNSPIDGDKVAKVASVNSDEAIELLKELNPKLVVINGTRIVSARVLRSVAARFINIHAGITPLYRGVHGAYWALVENNRKACGVTVHFVDEGIDTGGILAQEVIQPAPWDNFVTYPMLQLGAGVNLLKKIIADVMAGQEQLKPAPEGRSVLWSHPTLFEYLRHRVSLGVK